MFTVLSVLKFGEFPHNIKVPQVKTSPKTVYPEQRPTQDPLRLRVNVALAFAAVSSFLSHVSLDKIRQIASNAVSAELLHQKGMSGSLLLHPSHF